MKGKILDLGEFEEKEGFFDPPFHFSLIKKNSTKIKFSNLQE